MPFTMTEEKKQLRQQVRKELAALAPEELRASDDALFARFLALPQVREAKTIFAFWGIPGKEPETARLIQTLVAQGKRIGLPRMLPEHQMEVRQYDPAIPMKSVAFGIQEPSTDCPLIAKEDIDLILVPAVCYDRQGYRLGFGGGYYDRWLEHFEGFRVGLCRKAVLRDKVPTEVHDSRVDLLLTEDESLS
ncbi:MAG: 5-formyltetrahydrofolate cyclo-ligase [Lawsonibacter sp.]|nr:5-formyltetrahydrofolate cyclo-ligase [Lawsonibacter sp.]